MSEMNEIGDYTDDQVEAILNAFDVSDEDFALTSFVAEVRSIAMEPVDPDLARRHVPMLAEAAHLTSASVGTERRVDGPPSNRGTTVTPIIARKRRLVTKAAVVGLAAVLMGGGIASAATGNLPAPAQAVIAGMAARVGINIPSRGDDLPGEAAAGETATAANQASAEEAAGNTELFVDAVHDAIDSYTTALDAWTDCVADSASGRRSSQSNPDTSTEDESNLAEGCGEKPTLVIPDPAAFGLGRVDDAGPPFDVPPGPPEGAGPPDDAGSPDDAGPPADAGSPEDAGPPADAGPPEGAGQPADHTNGPPPDRGPPAGLP